MPARRGDKWEGRLKIDGRVVRTRRFDTKRSAVEWERRQRSTFDERGYDPSAGKVAVETLLAAWLEQREGRVSETTLNTDRYLLPTEAQLAGTSKREPVLPTWFRKLHVVKVNASAIQKWQDDLGKRDIVATTVGRYRTSLSSFFSWCVAEGYIAHNPVISVPPPKDRRAREDMRPLPAPEFDEVVRQVTSLSHVYGDLVLVLGRTGLRWGELRALQVRDFTDVPMPMLHVIRNQPEGSSVKAPKSGKSRNVPIPDYLVPVIGRFAVDKRPSDLLFTSARGAQLHRTQFVRAASWEATGRGRTLHDLRHTAACEWLIKGVPLTTVQAWLGHGSIQITARYLHHLGDFADRAALDVLNNAASKALSKRARKLPDLSSFGATPARRSAPDRGRSVGR
ncbi:tyrosine-type recombinase/integrase [Compostimonas suwonensis]|uniref:Site-specific recombinase XerD n=1 Tax=Compostimonas suwonensis TaxID=1048394 RepID=A0A2M9BBR3_9MICO|nr:tyrosine-type recombinase/integrase [Compostimonas suwonensis]PJJ55389.1 site-specific recombinase XerD [Compostimonas suwonensis]